MKLKYSAYFVALALTAGLSSCNDDTFSPVTEDAGRLNTASIVTEVTNAEIIFSDSPTSRATYALGDFTISVKNDQGTEVASWKYSQMPSLPTFPVGHYTVEAKSSTVQAAAWEAPYFTGTQSFDIVKNEVTDVETIVCKLANICVSVHLSDKLLESADDDLVVTVYSKTSASSLTFDKNETRKGYFEAAGQQTFEVNFKGTVKGNLEDFTFILRDVAAGQHRKINFDLNTNPNSAPDEFGDIVHEDGGINVSADVIGSDLTSDTPQEEEILDPSDRPGQEEPEGGEEPDPNVPDEPIGNAFTVTSETIDLEGINIPAEGTEYVVKIHSENPLSNLIVKIISESLSDDMLRGVGLCAEFDLANPGDLEDALQNSFGFPVSGDVYGQTDVTFNITEFVPLLNIYKDEIHKFQLTIKDQKGNQQVTTLTFKTLPE